MNISDGHGESHNSVCTILCLTAKWLLSPLKHSPLVNNEYCINRAVTIFHFIDTAYFQIQFWPIDHCLNWKVGHLFTLVASSTTGTFNFAAEQGQTH